MLTRFDVGTVITMNDAGDIFRPGTVVYDETGIQYVGPPESCRHHADQTVAIPEGIALPGLLNGHNHAAMSLMRGMADDSALFEWLSQHVWPLESRLTANDIYIGTLLAAAEMIHSGTVGFADMYFAMDAAAQAVKEAGLRAWLARGLVGAQDPDGQKLEEGVAFCQAWEGQAEGRIHTMLGPHAPYTCPPEYLARVARAAQDEGVGIHIHLSESQGEVDQIIASYGKSPIQLAYDTGIFASRTLIAHGVFISQEDLPWLKGLQGGVIACPVSNAKLGNGIMPYHLLADAGVAVGLGTDGAASTNSLDMFLEMKMMAWVQKLRGQRPDAFRARDALWAATRGTAAVLGHNGGLLAPGRPSDLIVLDGGQAHVTPEWDVLANVVYAAAGADVRYVVVAGRMILQEGVISTFDEQAVLKLARERQANLAKR